VNEHVEFQRSVAEHIASVGVAPPSDAFHDELISRAGRTGQRPEWLALLKEPPMRHGSTLAVGSPTARIAAILTATILLLAALAGAGFAGSKLLAADGIIVVDPTGNGTTTTIQDALEMADDGDEILVRPGAYDAPITISKDITLRGEDRDSVVLQIAADGPTLDHFWYGSAPYGILIEDSTAEISGLTIQAPRVGDEPTATAISVNGGAPLIHDVITDDGNGAAVYYQGAAAGELRDSSLQGIVFVQDASIPTIENNEIAGHVGVENPVGTESVVIRRNRLSGIAVAPNNSTWTGDAAPAIIEGNVLRPPADYASDGAEDFLGIDIIGNIGSIVRNNDIAGFQEGIKLREGSSIVLERNTLTDNRTAILVLLGDPRIVGNTVRGGTVGISVTGGAELTDNDVSGVSGRGIDVGFGGATLRGNRSCGNGEDLFVLTDVPVVDWLDDSNEICVPPSGI
jgi:nitrous oxidase accessory protein NosD